MGFFKDFFSRGSRVVKGQANAVMSSLEDATFESSLKQAIKDMKTELNKVVRSSADAMSNTNRLEAEYNRYIAQSKDWEEKAKKALLAGKEELAKKALAKKGEADTQVAAMQTSVQSAREASESLKTRVREIKKKITDAERNAATLIARKNAAAAQKKASQALAGIGDGDNAFAALSAFEESVKKEEASAIAYDDLANSDNDSQLEKEFESLDTVGVDSELERLKKEIGRS